MSKIMITVVNQAQKERAEYARDHRLFLDRFNDAYIKVYVDDVEVFLVPNKYKKEPEMIELYNYVFVD